MSEKILFVIVNSLEIALICFLDLNETGIDYAARFTFIVMISARNIVFFVSAATYYLHLLNYWLHYNLIVTRSFIAQFRL